MNPTPKLILLNGPIAVGKSTIADMYTSEHPLALHISTDQVIVMMSHWLEHEDEAWELAFEMVKGMAKTALQAGHDVILPCLIREGQGTYAAAFEKIAGDTGAQFFEIALLAPKKEVVDQLMARGTWGEAGAPPITEADRPLIESLYDGMLVELGRRPGAIRVERLTGDIGGTYARIAEVLKLPNQR